MTGMLLAQGRETDGRSWTVALPRPPRSGRPLRLEDMNASELMFFYGAPLAHVVCYEEHLRAQRAIRARRGLPGSPRSLSEPARFARMPAPPRHQAELLVHEL